ncbi:hypothetical protein ABE67_00605 [Cytobacillus firmus]|nr:hypothetical protein [Cytobacillus firmus]
MASPCLLGFEMSLHWPGYGQPGAASDRGSGKSVVRVRTWFNFGHKKQKTARIVRTRPNFRHRNRKKCCQSPNLSQLRTERPKKARAESKPASSKQNLLTEPHTFYYNKKENR